MSQSLTTYIASLRLSQPALITAPNANDYVLMWNEVEAGNNGHGTVYQASASAVASGLTVSALTALISALPTTLPATSGVLWVNEGVLQIS